MRVRVLGAGIYGCYLAHLMMLDGHSVEIHEKADSIFAGASGSIPARLHVGFHYPRSWQTRKACRDHNREFMERFGLFTRGVPINIYAVAAGESLVDFGQYVMTMRGEAEFATIEHPADYGLQNVEGALLTLERHIVTDEVRDHFKWLLDGCIKFNVDPETITVDDPAWDLTIDATFCANDSAGIDRYEPCIVAMLEGRTDKAITIMDGPFGSLYPWNEDKGLCSLSSAKYTPFSKACNTWAWANNMMNRITKRHVEDHTKSMVDQMATYYPAIREEYKVVGHKLSIRAMQLSGADSRLVDVIRVGERALRVRAGKIDAVIQAGRLVKDMIEGVKK